MKEDTVSKAQRFEEPGRVPVLAWMDDVEFDERMRAIRDTFTRLIQERLDAAVCQGVIPPLDTATASRTARFHPAAGRSFLAPGQPFASRS